MSNNESATNKMTIISIVSLTFQVFLVFHLSKEQPITQHYND